MTAMDMTELKKLLTQKLRLLEEVLAVTKKQPSFIEADDTDSLLHNIEQRQKLLDALDAIQAELPTKEEMRQDEECKRLAVETTQILRQIQTQDALNEKAALEQMDKLRAQLRKLQDGNRTVQGYEGIYQPYGATYFDTQK